MKKSIILFSIILSVLRLSATIIKSDYVALYDLNYVRNDKTTGKEQFILLMDKTNNRSCFLSSTIYAKDSLYRIDPNNAVFYGSEFPEIVVSENGKFNVYEDLTDYKYGYTEPNTLKWEILKEIKTIGTYKAQLAQCKAYGRTWYAWFSSDVPLNFGPYKFNGLPGFIVMLYDADKNLTFKLTGFKKKVKQYELANPKEYKMLDKSKFYKIRFKVLTSDNGVVIFNSAIEKKNWFDSIKKRCRTQVLFDIEYPQE